MRTWPKISSASPAVCRAGSGQRRRADRREGAAFIENKQRSSRPNAEFELAQLLWSLNNANSISKRMVWRSPHLQHYERILGAVANEQKERVAQWLAQRKTPVDEFRDVRDLLKFWLEDG